MRTPVPFNRPNPRGANPDPRKLAHVVRNQYQNEFERVRADQCIQRSYRYAALRKRGANVAIARGSVAIEGSDLQCGDELICHALTFVSERACS